MAKTYYIEEILYEESSKTSDESLLMSIHVYLQRIIKKT